MIQSIRELTQIDYKEVPWGRLMHFNGRAVDIPALLYILENDGKDHDKRMALITIANAIENKGGLTIASPIVLIYLIKNFELDTTNTSLYLRIFLKMAKALALQWELFMDSDLFKNKVFSKSYWQEDSPYLWPEFESEQIDQLLWGERSCIVTFDDPWFYTKLILLSYQKDIEKTFTQDLMDKGLIYEISTILNMIKDQVRHPFSLDFKWSTKDLILHSIDSTHLNDYWTNLTPSVAKYLSFDSMKDDRILKEFIRISNIEQQRGTCLVLVALDAVTNQFIGSCGIHDINKENAELGLWIKESAQGKGYGSQILEALIEICHKHTDSKSVIYCLEAENTPSIALCQKFDFKSRYDFIIEPTILKNKIRHMKYFSLDLHRN